MNRKSAAWPAALMITVFVASSLPVYMPPVETPFFSPDKFVHFLFYGLMATALYRVEFFFKRGVFGMLLAFFAISLYGASDEIHQSFTGRSCDIEDWYADTLGALIAVFSYRFLIPYRKLLELKLFSFGANKKTRKHIASAPEKTETA